MSIAPQIGGQRVGESQHRVVGVEPRMTQKAGELDRAARLGQTGDRGGPARTAPPGEVDELLRAHLRWLHEQGLQPDRAVDARQEIDERVVISEDALVAYLLAEADRMGVELLDDVDAVNVVDAHLAYFEAIGAVGPQAPLDDVI